MNHRPQISTRRIRLGTGFAESESKWIARLLRPLATRLRSFPETAVEFDLSVKDRDGADPRVTLVCRIAGRTRLVATATARRLDTAVAGVRDEMLRQVDAADTTRIRRAPRAGGADRHRRS